MEKKMAGWKAELLNKVGRITLIKHVLSTLPTFIMSLYDIPYLVLDKLSAMMSTFF
jgi:hypothetical protein